MKIDTSSYYPKSPLGDEDNDNNTGGEGPGNGSLFLGGKENGKEEDSDAKTSSETEERKSPILGIPAQEKLPVYDPGEWERFFDVFSTALSWILVPLLMPVFGTLLAFNLSILDFMTFSTKLNFTLIVAAINVGIPALLVVLLKRMGLVDDLGLNGRKERLIPYIITILCMGGTGLFMYFKHAPMWFVMFFIGGAVAGLVNLVINFRWKISAHSAAIAGIAAMLIRIMHEANPQPGIWAWLIIWIAACGLLGSARVWLGRHTAAQVLAGYAVGFLSVFFMTMIR
ncbi:MAG: phosphatase PAP2 family protein [Muribaculaceae bacterium]|nr:phosphatase PAP2 family protein [Muribaculaceae bacterium]